MHKQSYYIVNGITFYRVVAAPFLFLLIIYHELVLFKWFLGISFFTDAIDGYLARRYKVVSVLGSKLDSIGDDLTIAAGLTGMFVFHPGFIEKEMIFILLLLVLFVLQNILAFVRYRKMTNFHTYGAKIAAICQGVFLLLFFFDKPVPLLFYITVAVTGLELIEEILLVFLLPQWQKDVRGLYWVLKKKRE